MQKPNVLHRSSILMILAFALVIVLPSCIIVVEEDDDYDDHYRRRWSLDVIVYSSYSQYPGDRSVYSLNMNNQDALTGTADCFDFEGRYTVNSDALQIDGLSAGRQSTCGSGSLADPYIDGLKEARSFTASEDELVIYFGNSGNSMRFVPTQ